MPFYLILTGILTILLAITGHTAAELMPFVGIPIYICEWEDI